MKFSTVLILTAQHITQFLSNYVHNNWSTVVSTDRTIPKCGGKRLAGWNNDKPILWNKIWREAGCPSVGVLSQLRKRAKSRYKYPVRRLVRNQDLMRRKHMAEAMVSDSSRDFWHEVNRCKSRK